MRRLLGCTMVISMFVVLLVTFLACGTWLDSIPSSPQITTPTPEAMLELNTKPEPTPTPPSDDQPIPTLAPTTELLPTAEVLTITPQPPSTKGASPPTLTPFPAEETPTVTPPANQVTPHLTVAVQSLTGGALDHVIDGNGVLLVASLGNPTDTPLEDTVGFVLDSAVVPIATCHVEALPGSTGTCSAAVSADGWAWQEHRRVQQRTVSAMLGQHQLVASLSVAVQPKPVVLVHGTNSGAWAWRAWTSGDGFLAAHGLQGFAVGDGQFGIEPMDIGDFAQPRRPTKSIAENAAILARYIEAVREATGAERVDLVGHSMGGLISRYYIAILMPLVERPGLPPVPAVNQLYMIGTPNAGSTCAIVPAALGLYAPASTQVTPYYTQHIFNRVINDPRGVPFFILAGDPIRDYTALMCTVVPTDMYVSVASAAAAIPVMATTMPVLHGKQPQSPEVFNAVFYSLSRGPNEYPIPLPTGPAPWPEEVDNLQLAALYSGTLAPDGRVSLSVAVEQAPAVSFVLYNPAGDVDMVLTSSLGRDIRPDTVRKLPDVTMHKDGGPGTTVTGGFAIQNPEPGLWKVVLTPRAGIQGESFWAVAVFVQSDWRLAAEARPAVVQAGEAVVLRAFLTGLMDTTHAKVKAIIRDTNGNVVGELSLWDDGAHEDDAAGDGVFAAVWTTPAPGIYAIAFTAVGQRTDGEAFQRVTVVAVQAN